MKFGTNYRLTLSFAMLIYAMGSWWGLVYLKRANFRVWALNECIAGVS